MNRTSYKLFALSLIITLTLSLMSTSLVAQASSLQFANPTTTVFINEIHYDNASTDAGEAIEVAGPAGTDLTGWSIVLYNGANGAVYDTDALSGLIPDQQDGYGTVVLYYPVNGIQNGPPDGIALVNNSDVVIQFLSYEGEFAAVGGPADGMTSTDIGTLEGGSGEIGNSIQLIGSGTTYGDFTWSGEQASTFGAINNGQSFTTEVVAPVLVINEIDYDQPGTDTAEFIEIKNVGTNSADLSQFSLELINGTGGGAALYQTITLPAVTLAAGDYFVVCGDSANVSNCDLDVTPDSNLVQNGAPDAVGLRYNGELVDAVSYEGDTGAPYTEGTGSGLEDPGSTGADMLSISRYPDGTDTNVNNADLSMRCSTPGEANTSAASDCVPPVVTTDLLINEIDYDQPNTDTAEFVEIFNYGTAAVNLSGWTLDLVNGNGGAVYQSFDLSGYTLAAGDYFVVCGNAANVSDCDLDVTPDSNLIQNGAPDAVALSYNGTLIDAVSYEGDTAAPYTEGSGAGLVDNGADGSISRCPNGTDTDQNNLDFTFSDTSTPGAENSCTPPPPPEACGDEYTSIFTIQGSGLASTLDGSEVATEGVVVGDFQVGGKKGFFIQDATGDSDPATSDGIFVYSTSTDVSMGDHVRVRGTVDEYNTLTELTSVSQIWLCSTGNSVAATPISLPVTSLDDFESFEGMLVTFQQELVISEYYNFDRFGEIVLTTSRQYTPTAVVEPGPDAVALAAEYALNRITLDDGSSYQNPDPVRHPNGGDFSLGNLFRGGDTLTNVTGVLEYSYDLWRIQPTQGADYTSVNPRTAEPEDVGDNIRVASANVLNYFTTLNDRGANTDEEFQRQRAKIIAELAAIDADVVGLMEIENNTEAIADLVAGLNDAMGAGTYAYVNTGVIGTDAIKVAFIYKPATISLVGNYAILDSSVDPRFIDTRNRPALAQTYMDNKTGGIFTVVVNHFKSKSSSELGNPGAICVDNDPNNDVPDCDQGDGQGYFNVVRKAAAEALVDWLATDPTSSGDEDFLIIGDLNSYDKEDPIDAILAGADDLSSTADDYTDLNYAYQGEYAYSYVFDGQVGYLDHALASAGLVDEITGVTEWHNNADEPDLIDYNLDYKGPAQAAAYAPDAYRASDHDPIIIGLNVCDEIAPTLEASATPNEIWPPRHQYVDVEVTLTAADNFDPNPTVTLISVTSNEADNGLGDGDTAKDIVIVDDTHFQLRAERSAQGFGRIYTFTYKVTDACGNTAFATTSVFVPLNQKQ